MSSGRLVCRPKVVRHPRLRRSLRSCCALVETLPSPDNGAVESSPHASVRQAAALCRRRAMRHGTRIQWTYGTAPMPKRIAIVEDEAELASLLDYNLSRHGYQTQVLAGAGGTLKSLEP